MADQLTLSTAQGTSAVPFDAELMWLDHIDCDGLTPTPFEWLCEPPAGNSDDNEAVTKLSVSKRRKGYRAKRKNEPAELRAAIVTLQAELKLLLKRNSERKDQLGNVIAITGWRGVAFRQLQRRIDAETLNRELRNQLRKYESTSQQLLQTWQEHVKTLTNEPLCNFFPAPTSKPRMVFNEKDMHVVKALMDDVQASCSGANGVVDWNLSTTLEEPYKSEQNWQSDDEHSCEYSNLREEWVIPFNFGSVVPGIPNALATVLGKECTPDIIHTSLQHGHTDAVKFIYSLEDPAEGPEQYLCILVSRTSIEGHQAILRWRAISTLLKDPNVQYGEKGWGIGNGALVRAVSDQSTIHGTRFRVCSQYFRVSSPGDETTFGREHFNNFVKQMGHEGLTECHEWNEAFETVVLDSVAGLQLV